MVLHDALDSGAFCFIDHMFLFKNTQMSDNGREGVVLNGNRLPFISSNL